MVEAGLRITEEIRISLLTQACATHVVTGPDDGRLETSSPPSVRFSKSEDVQPMHMLRGWSGTSGGAIPMIGTRSLKARLTSGHALDHSLRGA
jgi:hypothetical protein